MADNHAQIQALINKYMPQAWQVGISGPAIALILNAINDALAASLVKTQLFGVNISGAEFAPVFTPAFASPADWAYLASKGVTYVRLPIAWEALQPVLSGPLDPIYSAGLTTTLTSAAANGVGVIIDLHNSAAHCTATLWNSGAVFDAGNSGTIIAGVNYFGDGTITATVFADVWTKLTALVVGMPAVIGYELMNEPGGWNFSPPPAVLTDTALLPFFQAAINAVRAIDTTTPIYVSWPDTYNGATSPTFITSLTGGNLRMDAHFYFDVTPSGWGGGPSLYSGTYTSYSQTPTGGVEQVAPYVQYLQTNGITGIVGEFNVVNYTTDDDPQWLPLQYNFLAYLKANKIPATMWTYTSNARFLNLPGSVIINPQNGVDDPRLLTMLAIGQQ